MAAVLAWLVCAIAWSEGAVRLAPQFRRVASGDMVSIVTSDQVKLVATAHEPAVWNGGAVILLHGISNGRGEWLAREAYRTLEPDSRGHGASGGDLLTYGVRERDDDDVHPWVDWMETQWKPRAVLGLGASLGADILLQSLPGEPGLTCWWRNARVPRSAALCTNACGSSADPG